MRVCSITEHTTHPRLTGVYIHLPFCDVKCAYCDFYSLGNRHVTADFWQKYLERLLDDLRRQHAALSEDTTAPVLAAIFFGGGTPSKAPGFIFDKVIRAVREIFSRSLKRVEITCEANPESLNAELLDGWQGAGVNRISVGMQSLDEKVLKYLGRLYNPAAYAEVLASLRRAGFMNFNTDFITGVPGQTVRSTLADLDFALGEGVTHLSLYQLTVENGTLLKQRIDSGRLTRPSDTNQVRQMDAAIAHLERNDFMRYEISNFTRHNQPCLHNLIYWTGRPYLGLGVSAHAFTGRRRFFHARSLEKYMSGALPEEDKAATPRDLLMNLLRLKRPFHRTRILSLYAGTQRSEAAMELDTAVRKGWLSEIKSLLLPTHSGLKYTDALIGKLWNL